MLGVKPPCQMQLSSALLAIVVLCPAIRPSSKSHLTYMSTGDSLASAVSAGRLLGFDLDFDSDEVARSILLDPQLAADIAERVEEWGQRVGQLKGDLESFVKGEHIMLSMTPFRHKSSTMGLIAPTTDGTWELRCRIPRPGLRVFGKFPCADIFVALHWEPRRALGDRHSLEYEIALIETNQRWNAALPQVTPLTGGSYRDYVSNNSSQV